MSPKEKEVVREKIADVQHEIWSHWMRYMFSCGTFNEDGSWTMPADKVKRWQAQMNTSYTNLTQREQASDIEQADKVLAIF